MRDSNAHLSDEELLLAIDGEVSPAHLAACQACRARRDELERAAAAFARLQQATPLPAAAGPRAQLRGRLAAPHPAVAIVPRKSARVVWQAAAAAVVIAGLVLWSSYRPRPIYAPSPRLTPGVARAVNRADLCHAPLPKNQVVTAEMRRRVFQVYGIANADPRAYEVDYLITPALGGADDIRNLWPQPYVASVWNARVKDALEDRLRDLVCGGQLDLAEAQRDISSDWIAAYKKYFGTDIPR